MQAKNEPGGMKWWLSIAWAAIDVASAFNVVFRPRPFLHQRSAGSSPHREAVVTAPTESEAEYCSAWADTEAPMTSGEQDFVAMIVEFY